jgi:hypothetical protein
VGRSLAVVAVLASVVWGVTLLRGADGTSLDDLERVPRTLLDAVPRLVMEGIESIPAVLRPEASSGSRRGPEGPTPGPAAEDVAPTVAADAETDDPEADNRGTAASDDEDEGNGAPERGAASPPPSSDLPARSNPQPAAADPPAEASPPAPRAEAPPPAPLSLSPGLSVPPAPEPVPAPGSLFLQVYPWGRVYIDGVYVGNTPLLGTEVGAGVHWIRIERPGYEPHVEYVVVEPSQALRLTGIILKRGPP